MSYDSGKLWLCSYNSDKSWSAAPQLRGIQLTIKYSNFTLYIKSQSLEG